MAPSGTTREPVEIDYPPLPRPGIVEQVRGFCQDHELARRREAWLPSVLGFMAAMAAGSVGLGTRQLGVIVAGVLPIVLMVSAILAGFVAVARSLLLVSMDRSVVARLASSGHFESLIGYFREADRSMVCFVVVAIAALVLRACDVRVPLHDRLVPGACGVPCLGLVQRPARESADAEAASA